MYLNLPKCLAGLSLTDGGWEVMDIAWKDLLRKVINTRLKTHSNCLLSVELDDALSFYTLSHWKNSHATSYSQLDDILHLDLKPKSTGQLNLNQPQMLKYSACSANVFKD